jgi:regulatory protein
MTDDYPAALQTALKKLQTSDRFESEVRKALSRYGGNTVDRVVAYLKERNYLNEERTVNEVVAQNKGRRAVGIHRLKAKLEMKGVPESLISQIEVAGVPSEMERALEVLGNKYRRDNPGDRPRAGRFLFSRGFDEEVVESVLASYFGEPSGFES